MFCSISPTGRIIATPSALSMARATTQRSLSPTGATRSGSHAGSNPQNQAWWNADERLRDGVGYFREIASSRDVQYETAYSSAKHLEGVGVVMGGVSGEILEHGYWGSMRDDSAVANRCDVAERQP